MKSKLKIFNRISLYFFIFIAAMLIFISIPLVSYAQTGTLGTETPKIYCTYEKDGVKVDGNNLSAGTYDVSFVLADVRALSVIELTATYDEEQITVESSPVTVISDNAESKLDSMGQVLTDGNIVFGFVSENDDCSVFTEDEIVLATVKMTFASDCDAKSYLNVSNNPNLTFAQVDYGDGYNDSYALLSNQEAPSYNGELFKMTCDETPVNMYKVNGSLVVMTNNTGSTDNIPVVGTYNIKVYSDSERTNLVKETNSVYSAERNSFNIRGLSNGTYYLSISSEYAITRNDISVVINDADITADPIPIIACNFDGNSVIAAADAVPIYSASELNEENAYLNLDGNSVISPADAVIVYACSAGSFSYKPIVIE